MITETLDRQCPDRRWRCTRNLRVKKIDTVRSDAEGQGGILLPGIRRSARDHPDDFGRERGSQPDRDRNRIEE